MLGMLTAYAEPVASEAAQTTAQANGGFSGMLISMLIVLAIFYFMMIRPQKKQQKAQMAMRAALKVGDKVVTIGGICGKVAKIKDDYIYIESSMPGAPEDKSYIKFKKNAIETVEKSVEA